MHITFPTFLIMSIQPFRRLRESRLCLPRSRGPTKPLRVGLRLVIERALPRSGCVISRLTPGGLVTDQVSGGGRPPCSDERRDPFSISQVSRLTSQFHRYLMTICASLPTPLLSWCLLQCLARSRCPPPREE